MMNNKGFTLIEVIATIALLAIVVVIATPSMTSFGEYASSSALKTKMEMATSAARMWAIDNQACFISEDCDMLSSCTNSNSIYVCNITLKNLAEEGLIAYDEGKNIYNPITNNIINDEYVTIKYDSSSGIVEDAGNSLE